jgi:hypothetical protein
VPKKDRCIHCGLAAVALQYLTPQRDPTSHPLEVALAQGHVWMPRFIKMLFTEATTEAKSTG